MKRPASKSCSLLLALLPCSATRAEVLDFAAKLDGVCANSGSQLKGWGTFIVDTSALRLDYRVEYDSSIIATFAHIHGPIDDGCGTGGSSPIIVFLETTNPASGTHMMVQQEFVELITGMYYTNIHTVAHPAGIITGHIYPVPKNRFLTLVPVDVVEPIPAATHAIRVKLITMHHPFPPRLPAPPTSPPSTASTAGWARSKLRRSRQAAAPPSTQRRSSACRTSTTSPRCLSFCTCSAPK
jgi:hypothetical protein